MKRDPFIADTHEVFNQSTPLDAYNLYESDAALKESLYREGAGWAASLVSDYGRIAGHELFQPGFKANENPPVFYPSDRFGHRIDFVDYHPAYHFLMETAARHGLHSLPWTEGREGPHVARAAMFYCHAQIEAGTCCPLTMTFASIPAIRRQPDLANEWEPLIVARAYDPSNVPAADKPGLTIGMAMTEKQGGSDVRANTTEARPVARAGPGEPYELFGHKWFCSAPMSDAFLVLAHTDKGLSCFLLPRWRPDGEKNALYIQRLKNKLGNRSNASSEMEFRRAYARMVGEEGRGVATIIEMVAMTRFDCMTGSAGLMRQAVANALHHANYRKAFGKVLRQHPLMENVLADLAMESEAALMLALRVGRALDEAADKPEARALARIATAVGKYWICKQAPNLIYEASECLGGGGYIEESILPRLYREAPVNAIWEGCGNIQALDVLRAMSRTPEAVDVFFAEIKSAKGADARLDAHIKRLEQSLGRPENMEYRSRRLIEDMALGFQGALMVQHAPPYLADCFCQARLAGSSGRCYGTLPDGVDVQQIIARAMPILS